MANGGRGASKAPITFSGTWDATQPYLPLQIVTDGGLPYLAVASSTGVAPSSNPDTWLLLGGGGVKLWVGPSAPTDGSLFWYDTDGTC